MTEEVRKMERSEDLLTGRYWGGPHNRYSTSYSYKEYMEDVLCRPWKSGKPFSTWKIRRIGSINGSENARNYASWIPDVYQKIDQPQHMQHLSFPNRPTDGSLLTSLLKSTNPESSKSNFPLFMFELRELPKMLMGVKSFFQAPKPRGTVPKAVAQQWLAAQFGWKPFVTDLAKMLTCLQDIQKRAVLYNEIQREGGKVFVRDLHKSEERTAPEYFRRTVQSIGSVIYAYETLQSRISVRGYAEYRPIHTLPTTDREQFRRAWRTYHALHLRPADLWDAFPWSWFVDYFLNVGDYVAAKQGGIYFRLHEYALMENIDTYRTARINGTRTPTSRIDFAYSTKRRWSPPIAIDTNYATPFLTGYQTSILGSLLTSRLFK